MPRLPAPVERWLPTPLLRASALVHLAALACVAAAPRRWRWALAAAAADQLVLFAASLAPRSGLVGPLVARLPAASAARGEVALTFDDGPDPQATPQVLDLLDAAGARASFFMIGRRAAAHRGLVAEVARRGHRVENHTWGHGWGFAWRGPRGMGREVDRAQRLLTGLAGRPPGWFRPPAGMRSPWLAGVLAGRGLALASWSRRGFDTVDHRQRRVLRRLTRGLAGGDVLVLHDGSSPRLGGADGGANDAAGGQPLILELLPPLLDALARRGLTAVALPDPPAARDGRPANRRARR
jgi:peptidoglycan/xylan/chitin deacetylase (PgdA/CDA1 family)